MVWCEGGRQSYLVDQIEMSGEFSNYSVSVGAEEKRRRPSDLNTIDYHPIHITIYLIIISEALMVFNINILNIARNYYS